MTKPLQYLRNYEIINIYSLFMDDYERLTGAIGNLPYSWLYLSQYICELVLPLPEIICVALNISFHLSLQ